jgi:UDP-2,3-diacylglucosamine pyrophosphatase LpxH
MMSDCHRGDGSWADSFAKNQNLFTAALNVYNRKKYTYIELGDGDELWENKKLSDILSTYKNVFKLLSRFHMDGRLYFLMGNHDFAKRKPSFVKDHLEAYIDETDGNAVPLFPEIKIHEGLILRYEDTENKIFLIHGHQVDFVNGPAWRLSKFFVRRFWRPIEIIGVNDPTSASKNHKRKNTVEERLTQWTRREKQILIAGHTHRYVFPKPGHTLYFNDGSCVANNFITAIEIAEGSISLVKWSYMTRKTVQFTSGGTCLPAHKT